MGAILSKGNENMNNNIDSFGEQRDIHLDRNNSTLR